MTFGQIHYLSDVQRIASILLLFTFLYNILGFYFSFSVLDRENRLHMIELVKNGKHLETIRIHKSEIKNIVFWDDGKEMSYQGEMYDIKDRSSDGNFLVFHCINDKTEKNLLAGLDRHAKYNSDPNSSSEKKQKGASKTPVKDLFFLEKIISTLYSDAIVFPTSNCKLQSVDLAALPLPPPEISFS